MLEEGSFRNRAADFVLMFLFRAMCMTVSFFKVDLKTIKLLKTIILM